MNFFARSRSAALVLFCALTAFGQAAKTAVVRWKYGTPHAVTDIRYGIQVKGIRTDQVHIYVALFDIRDTEYNRAWVQVVNHGDTPLEFDPQSAFLKDGKRVSAEVPDSVAEAIQKAGEAKSQELSSAHCTIFSAPTCAPTNMQMQMSKDVAALSAQQADWILNKALKPTTLAPGEQVVGAILFRKGKKAANYTLAVRVGSETFEFPVSALNKPPSYD